MDVNHLFADILSADKASKIWMKILDNKPPDALFNFDSVASLVHQQYERVYLSFRYHFIVI